MGLTQQQKVQIAGLFHDIGKVGERAGVDLSETTKKSEHEYCPLDKNKKYTHKHVLWTLEFFEQVFRENFPDDIEIKNIMHWASLHHQHQLSGKEEIAVQLADRVSSGHDRNSKKEDYTKNWRKWSKLSATLFSIKDKKDSKNNKIHYIKPVSCDDYKSLETLRSDFLSWDKEKEKIYELYKPVWNNMIEGFRYFYNQYKEGKINEYLLISCLCELQKKFLTWVPAATNICTPNTSLYDHQRTTAGFAHCLLENKENCNYLLVETSGIQKFIYNIYETKNAAKILRGKSTFIEIIPEIITYRLSKLRITTANVLANNGNSICYILPATTNKKAIENILNSLKEDLYKKYYSIGIDYVLKENISYNEFTKDRVKILQDEVFSEIGKKKLSPISYLGSDIWTKINKNISESNGELCRHCKKNIEKPNDTICEQCEMLRNIGEKEVREDFKVRVLSSINEDTNNSFKIFKDVYISWIEHETSLTEEKERFSIKILRSLESKEDFKFLPTLQGYYSTSAKTLDLNEMSEHSAYLAMVKADVDNLGEYIKDKCESTGELASLGGQLNWFFKGRTQRIIKDNFKDDIYPVYIGGDDFFLIGKHYQMAELVNKIKIEFDNLSCNSLGWSCSYLLFKSKTPLLNLSDTVDNNLGKIKSTKGKNQIYFNKKEMKWQKLGSMLKLKNKFEKLNEQLSENKDEDIVGFYRRMLQFSNSARKKNPEEQDLIWQSYYHYYLRRKFPKTRDDEDNKTFIEIENIFNVLNENKENSIFKEYYAYQALEFHLLEQRRKNE